MADSMTVVFEEDGDWWIGYVEELPGANAQGKTLQEAPANLKEVIQLVIAANQEARRQVVDEEQGDG